MYGAIIGDLAGSVYEYSQIKKITPVFCDNLINNDSFYSDDTILTIAILDAILNNTDYDKKLREYVEKFSNYHPNFTPYFETTFSPSLMKWASQKGQGISAGNGAMMRVSPVGYLFNMEEDVILNSKKATIPSHNCTESINCATTVALIIFYARKDFSKDEIIKKLNLKIINNKIEKFNYTCGTTIDLCLYPVFTSNSFEESLMKVLTYGGDTDTNACIVGSMAEALYRINTKLIEQANNHIPQEFQKKLELAYQKKGK